MLITNLRSPRSGRPVANQYCILFENGLRIFQSYNSIIAKMLPNGEFQLAKDAWLSRTTTKYLREFIGWEGDNKSFQKFINSLKRF